MNKKYLIPVIIIWVIVGGLFVYWRLQKPSIEYFPTDIPIDVDVPIPDEVVVFSTDKTEYEEGETIKMLIENNTDASLPYLSVGEKYWELEYLLGDNWMSFDYNAGPGFEVTDKQEGEKCYLVLYEQSELELGPGETLSSQWNQKVCPFTGLGPKAPKTVYNIKSGMYRFVFKYYPKIQDSSDGSGTDHLKELVYSNAFTIK